MPSMETGEMELETPEQFARRLNLPFKNYLLLSRALTHRSYLNEHPEALEDNERLEFLGDAVLDFLVGAWLYNRYPEMQEGDLTRLRSGLVRTEQLADFASRLDFGKALRLGHGESQAGGRKRLALLCATFESVIGALYLDAGLEAVQQFVEPLLAPAAEQVVFNNELDAKSHLQELVQAKGYPPPQYRTTAAFGPEHSKTFRVEVLINGEPVAEGVGSSKQIAAQEAARAALRSLKMEAPGETQRELPLVKG